MDPINMAETIIPKISPEIYFIDILAESNVNAGCKSVQSFCWVLKFYNFSIKITKGYN